MSAVKKNRLVILFFVLAIIIALVNPFLSTSQNIDDSIPSSYVIVPILMLPILAVFSFKGGIAAYPSKKSIAIGALIALAAIALTYLFEVLLGALFFQFRLDMLVFPIIIIAFAVILFGARSLSKFQTLAIYALFASPLVFVYLLGANSAFAQINTVFVFVVLHAFLPQATYSAPFTINAGAYSIGIGSACAGIAVFIAIVLFLFPVAHLLDGKNSDKARWLAAGFGLLLVFNFLRMASIAGVWIAYGPMASVSFVHGFAGILLFYAAIVIMILIAGRFGLAFPRPAKTAASAVRTGSTAYLSYATVIILSLLYLLIA